MSYSINIRWRHLARSASGRLRLPSSRRSIKESSQSLISTIVGNQRRNLCCRSETRVSCLKRVQLITWSITHPTRSVIGRRRMSTRVLSNCQLSLSRSSYLSMKTLSSRRTSQVLVHVTRASWTSTSLSMCFMNTQSLLLANLNVLSLRCMFARLKFFCCVKLGMMPTRYQFIVYVTKTSALFSVSVCNHSASMRHSASTIVVLPSSLPTEVV